MIVLIWNVGKVGICQALNKNCFFGLNRPNNTMFSFHSLEVQPTKQILCFFFDIHGSSQKKRMIIMSLLWPPPCNSDHQDDITCLVGDSNLNLHFPLLQGGGHIHGSFGFPILPTSHCFTRFGRPWSAKTTRRPSMLWPRKQIRRSEEMRSVFFKRSCDFYFTWRRTWFWVDFSTPFLA